MTDMMVKALEAKYNAQYKEAEMTLQIYFKAAVGIGEHPQHMEEMDKLIASMTDASDKLITLKTIQKNDNEKNLLVE